MKSAPKRKVKFLTLGCRVNQYETQAIREQFRRAGYAETKHSDRADVIILNTCTVTNASDRECRYLVRKSHRENPNAKIIVTGCYVERNRSEIDSLPGVSLSILNRQKDQMVRLVESCFSDACGTNSLAVGHRHACVLREQNDHICSDYLQKLWDKTVRSQREFTPLFITHFEGRSRAYVKIEDGCNHACSFCKVVLVRGPARSRPFDEVVSEVRTLGQNGYAEVVLTGVQLGAYGWDQGRKRLLPKLIRALDTLKRPERIRLSSIEPTDVTDELAKVLAESKKACPHLHIPLQSGSDVILERMNRRYRKNFYRDLMKMLEGRINNFILTTDVMVGFPGETEEAFEETCQFLSEIQPYKVHIFPYSRREGTRAARFSGAVDGREIRKRVHRLAELEGKWRIQVHQRFLGKKVKVLVEDGEKKRGWMTGRMSNFVEVRFPGKRADIGKFKNVFINEMDETVLIASTL